MRNELNKTVLKKYLKEQSRELLTVVKALDLADEDDYKLAIGLTRKLIKKAMSDAILMCRVDELNCYVRDEREFAMQLGWNEAVESLNILRENMLSLLEENEN